MKFRKLLLMLAIATQILLSTAFAGNKTIKKVNLIEFRNLVEKECLKNEDCNLSDANLLIDQIELNGQSNLIDESIKHDLKGQKLNPIEIIRRIQMSGIKVIKVTIKIQDKVLTVITDNLDDIYELPVVKEAIRSGSKIITFTVEGTFKGVRKITTVTVKTFKKLGLVKPIKIVFKTIFNVLKDVTNGTIEVINLILKTNPIVIIIDGIEHILKLKPIKQIIGGVKDIIHTTWFISLEVTEVLFKGVWKAVEYSSKGLMLILGLPINIFKTIFGL